MSALAELRLVRQEAQNVAYSLGEINQKIKLAKKRKDLQSIRVRLIEEAKRLEEKRSALIAQINASPYSRTDVVDVLERLVHIESAIVNEGTKAGHDAIRAFIDFLVKDADRLATFEGKAA